MPPITVISRLPAPDRSFIDISISVSPTTPEFPGDTPFTCGWTLKRSEKASVNLSEIRMSPHVGTHADAPLHIEDGWDGSETLPVAAFMGAAYVLNASHVSLSLSLEWMQEQFAGEAPERLLLQTGRSVSSGKFPEEWPVLTTDAAQWLVKGGTRLVGTDAPSVDSRHSETLEVHHELFIRGANILENLALEGITPGWYELFAAPMKLVGLDGAPVRALLRKLIEHA
ncbi:MAG: cyclase family protein [Gemmatimonadaceae bacterium]